METTTPGQSKWLLQTVPVNPDYNWEQDPTDQAAYFNPVTLCNKEVHYANSIIQLVGVLMKLNTAVGALKLKIKKLKLRKEDMEADVISREEPGKKDTSNLMLLNAFVRGKLLESEQGEEYAKVVEEWRSSEEQLSQLEVKRDNTYRALDALELVSQNLQTALSYHKAEMRITR